MSPALDMPLNRREAMTSLLTMLAFVMGVGVLPDEADAEGFPTQNDGNSPVQPHPGSGRSWWCQMNFAADEHHLPIPRNPELESQLTFDGHTLRMDVSMQQDPVWVDDVERDPIQLGTFIFAGEPAAFLDAISAEGDRVWLKKQLEWAERPGTFCPVCLMDGYVKEGDQKVVCPNCNGRKWIYFTPEEGQRMLKKAQAKRQRRINRAVKRHAESAR